MGEFDQAAELRNLNVRCGDCREPATLGTNEVALNLYHNREAMQLRFRCPICKVVQLIPIPKEKRLIASSLITEKHYIKPIGFPLLHGEGPFTEDYISDFTAQLSDDPLGELDTPNKNLQSENKDSAQKSKDRSSKVKNYLIGLVPLWFRRG